MEYLEIIAQNGHIINFSYKNGSGAFTLDLNNAVEMFSISDFKRFFAIADSSAEGSFAIAEKVQVFTAARLEYEKSFLNGTFSKNQKLIAKLEKILLFLSDSFGISCDIAKPEKITKKRGTGLIFNVDACGRRYAEAVTGDFYKVGGVWYFIHKKPEIKRGGYVLSAAAYGCRVAAFGYFKTAKNAIEWITENNISDSWRKVDAAGKARAAEMRARFLEAVENSGLSWVIESNPSYFEDFLTTAEAEAPAERAEMPQKATESTTAAYSTTEAEKAAETPENAPTECATPAEAPAEAKKPVFVYGMRLRGYSIGCQPAGVIERRDDPAGRYYDIIVYESPLTAEEMRAYSLDDLTERTADTARHAADTAAPTEAARPADDQPTEATEEVTTTAAGITTDRQPATAARIDRRTRHKPHISPKTARGYISIIDGTKARHGAKYAPTMARPTPPHSIGLQKMGFPGVKKGNTDQSDKILQKSVKTRFGFCIGLSPPGGYQKFSL